MVEIGHEYKRRADIEYEAFILNHVASSAALGEFLIDGNIIPGIGESGRSF